MPKGPVPRAGRRPRLLGKHVPQRISRSSSPVRSSREDSLHTWMSDTWANIGTTLQSAHTGQLDSSTWQPEETQSASAVIDGLWDEICGASALNGNNKGPNDNQQTNTSPGVTQSSALGLLDGVGCTASGPAPMAIDASTGGNNLSLSDNADLYSLLAQGVTPPNNLEIAQPSYNNFSILGSTPSPFTGLPWSMPFCPPEDISPILTLTLETLVKPQLEIFFERVYPMIPIFPRTYVMGRLSDVESHQNRTFVALILSMVSLSLIHPLKPEEVQNRPTRAKQSKTLMDEVIRLRSKWDWASQASVEGATTSYMLFGTMFELGHAEGARLRLKEAIGIGELLRLDEVRTYTGVEPDEARRRMRLYWVLGITERAYALQRFGSITFHGSLHTPTFTTLDASQDLASRTLLHLAKLFSFVDSDIVSCWNGKCDPLTCTTLTKERVRSILRTLNGTPTHVFGSDIALTGLSEVQQADLLITWQWLRNRVWRLAAGHGIAGDGLDEELGVGYVVDVASTTVLICRRLSTNALEAHGCGFVEKLYDIASIVTELMQTSTKLQSRLMDVAKTDQWMDLLQTLYTFVASHRSGTTFVQPMAQALSVANGVKLLCAAPL
ncbi:hypothetical protein I302_101601 [Kwoniella bestiolae CBS 10118]|uniref:Transcription factor domain-containing protein n=1 Tax=Kwoniella bestiolae CBS 10118 TaxID=1296100 RepID=A0A1B9GCP3_9TREE|nr:hypothetical protein I302_00282 [Kwoniella bestiolae CBS 10118]OCF28793.1 hypothetical protein I302_00282 [Kwoniella bestiolae CBS 10118]